MGWFGIFSEATPMQKQVGVFLTDLLADLSAPIARDDRVHVEYIPTQVFCEYFRTQASNGGEPIHGICYPSSVGSGRSYCFFMDQLDMRLDEKSATTIEAPQLSASLRDTREPSFALASISQVELVEWGLGRRVRRLGA